MKGETVHICTLDTKTPIGYKNWYGASIRVSPRNPNTKCFFRSIAAIEMEKMRHSEIKSIIIHPLSLFTMYWERIFTVIFGCSLIMYPIYMIFTSVKYYLNVKTAVWYTFLSGEMFFNVSSLLDIIVTFMTGHPKYNYKRVILKPRVIIRIYFLSANFLIDLICSLPVYIIIPAACIPLPEICMHKNIRIMMGLQMFSALKVLRIIKFIKYFNKSTEAFRHKYHLRVVLKYFILFIVGIHWLTCLHILVEQFLKFNSNLEFIYSHNDTNLMEFSQLITYLNTLLTILTFFLGISAEGHFRTSSSFRSNDEDEIAFFVIYAIFGYCMCIVLLVLIIQIIRSVNAPSTKYQAIVSQVTQYMSHKNLPENMRQRILTYYEYRFQKKYFRENKIFNLLSETLRRDINLYSCRTLTETVSVLKDLPPEIISAVVSHLKLQVFLYNDIIVKAGTTGDCMYFIANGTVAVTTPTGKEICHLQDGSYFGEIALVSCAQKRVANVVAIEICEIYKLDRRSFRKCFPETSHHYKKMEQIARERMEKTMLLEELHKKYILERSSKRQAEELFNKSESYLDF